MAEVDISGAIQRGVFTDAELIGAIKEHKHAIRALSVIHARRYEFTICNLQNELRALNGMCQMRGMRCP